MLPLWYPGAPGRKPAPEYLSCQPQHCHGFVLGSEQQRLTLKINKHPGDRLAGQVKAFVFLRHREGEYTKGKRAILQGHHHISTEELRKAVRKAEKEANERKKKKQKKTNQQAKKMDETSSSDEEEEKEEDFDEIGDCIIVGSN